MRACIHILADTLRLFVMVAALSFSTLAAGKDVHGWKARCSSTLAAGRAGDGSRVVRALRRLSLLQGGDQDRVRATYLYC